MGGAEKASDFSAPTRPTINLPPRASFESLFFGVSGFSPGPMTLVSNLFSPDSNHGSFSQLLAGAMASPVAAPNSKDYSSKQVSSGDGSEENLGFKQNRPMSLVVPSSPMFMMSPGLHSSPGFFSPLQSPFGMSHQQALAHVTAQAALSQSYQPTLLPSPADSLEQNPSALYVGVGQHMDAVETAQGNSKMPSGVSQSARKLSSTSSTIDKPGADGYNWRKYGQKQVKASEYPRSYYKCTHVNCPVKKKIEHSLEGRISKIIYKGQHNHEPPCSNKHPKDGGNVSCTSDPQVKSEIVQSQTQIGRLDDGLPSHSVCGKDQDSTHDCDDNDEIVLNEGDDYEPNRKRRNMGIAKSEASSSHKTVMESKIIVQTQSEVDLLDDGYKWRKYGQKVVKGNPHPRSYYRCTFVGCNVRKHVERASTDQKSVVTTYEGKHNHDAPSTKRCRQNSRNGSHSKAKPAPHEEMGIGSQKHIIG